MTALAALAACSFHPEAPPPAGAIDAARTPPVHDTALADDAAAGDASPDACAGTVWLTDFSVDPTTLDDDGVPEFAMRDGSALGGTLADDVWTQAVTGGDIRPLDTEPKQTFTTRTLVHVRMANTMVPPAGSGNFGAVFWINVGYAGSNMSVLFVDAELQPGGETQTAFLYTKTDAGTVVPLFTESGLDAGMHDYYLDIDPVADVVQLAIDTMSAVSLDFPAFPAGTNTDQWASIDAWANTTAEYGYERVESCP
jgi:hypothetical protein